MMRRIVYFVFACTALSQPAESSQPHSALSQRVMGPGNLASHQEKAQFYLSTCQPRAAWREAAQIDESDLRNIFEATILTLSSVPRAHSKQMETRTVTTATEVEKYPFEPSEIWADEWQDLDLGVRCQSFPLLPEHLRAEAKEKAKALFGQIPPDKIKANFTLLSLATDSGYRPQFSEADLADLGEHSESPYFARLMFFAREPGQVPAQVKQSRTQISINSLSFAEVELAPHPLNPPWLLRGEL